MLYKYMCYLQYTSIHQLNIHMHITYTCIHIHRHRYIEIHIYIIKRSVYTSFYTCTYLYIHDALFTRCIVCIHIIIYDLIAEWYATYIRYWECYSRMPTFHHWSIYPGPIRWQLGIYMANHHVKQRCKQKNMENYKKKYGSLLQPSIGNSEDKHGEIKNKDCCKPSETRLVIINNRDIIY